MKSKLPLFAVVAVILSLAFAFQGRRGIWQPDEGYYAGTAVTMAARHSLLIPYLGEDEIFLDKPPLIYWGILAGLELFGHTEFAVRFFHGVSYALTCGAVGLLAWNLFKDRRLAWASALMYATMPVPLIAAHFVTPDGLLVLWTTLAGLCFWNSTQTTGRSAGLWKLALAAAVGVGFLAKGPAVLIPCGAMFVFLLIRRRVVRYFWTPWSLAALVTFCAIGLSWYAWICRRLPGAFDYLFNSQIWGRLVSEDFDRNPGLTGALIYLPVLLAGTLPWSAAWWDHRHLRSGILSKAWWRRLAADPAGLWLTCWIAVSMLVLALASSKLGLYALPIFAPLAIVCARLWNQPVPQASAVQPFATVPSASPPATAEPSVQSAAGAAPTERPPLPPKRQTASGLLPWPTAHPARAAALVGLWIVTMLAGRLLLAYWPTTNDMRALWTVLQDKLPQGDYELCTVDDRADGLLFYAPVTLEHLTNEPQPYPTYTKTEHVLAELIDRAQQNERVILLLRTEKEKRQVGRLLQEANIPYHATPLGRRHGLIIPDPIEPHPAPGPL